jgi:hypothetical protein
VAGYFIFASLDKLQVIKKIGITLLLALIIAQGFSQITSAEEKPAPQQAVDSNSVTKVVVGQDRLAVEDNGSKINVRVGNRGLSILESLEGKMPKFEFEKYDNDKHFSFRNDDGDNDSKEHRKSHFKGHWSGIELGFNNYLTDNYSFSLPAGIDYMNLNSGKAMNFNLNFTQLSIGIFRHVGFVTGLGLNWNNYRFDGNNTIEKDADGNIVEYAPAGVLKKSKLATLYLDLPFMLEIQVPTDHKRINIAAGPIGAVKLSSHTKMIFEDGDKVKSDGDFSLNLLRYGATARIGYENFELYGTYYVTPLFKKGKGPGGVDLYPFEIGVAFTID